MKLSSAGHGGSTKGGQRLGCGGVRLFTGAALLLAGALATGATDWPGFRGFSQSHTGDTNLPLKWTEETKPAWRAALPGTGQSSPIIFGANVFVTSVEGTNKESLHLLCFDLATGTERWRKQWTSSAPEKDSDYISKAAPTPAADADRVYALFESGDFIALTHDGKELWRRELATDYGPFEGNHGQGSSPSLTGHGVVVLVDHKGQSFIASFDKATGVTQWNTDRETSSAWSTPLVVERGGREEIIASASGSLIAYAPANGERLWERDGFDGNNVPSPTTDGEHLLIGSRKKGANQAVRLDGRTVADGWLAAEATSAFGSPLIHRGRAYYVSDAGLVYCYRLADGEPLWDGRIGDSTWASPLAAGERIYFFGKNGRTTVIAPADELAVLAENALSVDPKDRVYGYAVADGRLVFRLGSELVCLAGKL